MIKQYAKAWVAGVGGAVVTYASTWTDDPRVIGFFAIVTAVATYLVPNAAPTGPAEDLRQPNYD